VENKLKLEITCVFWNLMHHATCRQVCQFYEKVFLVEWLSNRPVILNSHFYEELWFNSHQQLLQNWLIFLQFKKMSTFLYKFSSIASSKLDWYQICTVKDCSWQAHVFIAISTQTLPSSCRLCNSHVNTIVVMCFRELYWSIISNFNYFFKNWELRILYEV